MNWEVIGALGEWAGALAVIVTLFYLAKQIRQSNRLAEAETEREWFAASYEISYKLTKDKETAELVARALQDYENLSQPEKALFHGAMGGFFNHTDMANRLHAKGLLSDDIPLVMLDLCVGVLHTKGGLAWWENNRDAFAVKETVEAHREKERPVRPIDSFDVFQIDDRA